jgi:signal transduction histidine kinase
MSSLPNILIVDDNSTNLIYLEIILRDVKANLIQACSGFEALQATHDVDLSLAILDVQMPLMNGYELAVRLNAERKGNMVPIIFLTAAYPDSAKILEGYESGAVDYIIKPLNKHILVSKINVFLEMYWQKQRVIDQTALLRASEVELQQAKQQLELLNLHLVEARDEEMESISHKVHNELWQAMTSLYEDLTWLRKRVDHKEEVTRKLDDMIQQADFVMGSARKLSSDLHPPMLDDMGLAATIEWYCKDIEHRFSLPCSLELDETAVSDRATHMSLFRILQEAMTNIVRHAQASSIRVQLVAENGELILTIADNGIGIPEEKKTDSKSFGIICMEQRAQQCGGSLDITSESGNGTRIMARIPVRAEISVL